MIDGQDARLFVEQMKLASTLETAPFLRIRAVLCLNKTNDQLIESFAHADDEFDTVIGTKIEPQQVEFLRTRFDSIAYHDGAKLAYRRIRAPRESRKGTVSVVSAGLGDYSVAEEATQTLEAIGIEPRRIYDVGVTNLSKLFDELEGIRGSDVVIVVAGMEAALFSVVGGLVGTPVVGVPTSVGYGTHFDGITAALCMLNSCAPGCSIVNVDNGFGAAVAAARVCLQHSK